MQGPNANVFASQWNIGFKLSIKTVILTILYKSFCSILLTGSATSRPLTKLFSNEHRNIDLIQPSGYFVKQPLFFMNLS